MERALVEAVEAGKVEWMLQTRLSGYPQLSDAALLRKYNNAKPHWFKSFKRAQHLVCHHMFSYQNTDQTDFNAPLLADSPDHSNNASNYRVRVQKRATKKALKKKRSNQRHVSAAKLDLMAFIGKYHKPKARKYGCAQGDSIWQVLSALHNLIPPLTKTHQLKLKIAKSIPLKRLRTVSSTTTKKKPVGIFTPGDNNRFTMAARNQLRELFAAKKMTISSSAVSALVPMRIHSIHISHSLTLLMICSQRSLI